MAKPLFEKVKKMVKREARIAKRALLEMADSSTVDGLNLVAIFGKDSTVVKDRPY